MPKILPSIRGGEVHIPIVTLASAYGIYLLIFALVGVGIIGGISMDILPYITNDSLIAGAVTAFTMVFLVGLFIYWVDYRQNKVEAVRNAIATGTTVPGRKMAFDYRYIPAIIILAVLSAAFVTVVNCAIGYYLGTMECWLIAGMIGFFIGPFFAIVFDYFFYHDIAAGCTTVSEKLVECISDYNEAQKKIAEATADATAETLKSLEGVDMETLRALLVILKK